MRRPFKILRGSKTQRQIAESLGVTVATVTNWERGDTLPHLSMVDSLAAAYGTTPDRVEKTILEAARVSRQSAASK